MSDKEDEKEKKYGELSEQTCGDVADKSWLEVSVTESETDKPLVSKSWDFETAPSSGEIVIGAFTEAGIEALPEEIELAVKELDTHRQDPTTTEWWFKIGIAKLFNLELGKKKEFAKTSEVEKIKKKKGTP